MLSMCVTILMMVLLPSTTGQMQHALEREIEKDWEFPLDEKLSGDVSVILKDLARFPELRITPNQYVKIRQETFGNLLVFIPDRDIRFARSHLQRVLNHQCVRAGISKNRISGVEEINGMRLDQRMQYGRVYDILVTNFSEHAADMQRYNDEHRSGEVSLFDAKRIPIGSEEYILRDLVTEQNEKSEHASSQALSQKVIAKLRSRSEAS